MYLAVSSVLTQRESELHSILRSIQFTIRFEPTIFSSFDRIYGNRLSSGMSWRRWLVIRMKKTRHDNLDDKSSPEFVISTLLSYASRILPFPFLEDKINSYRQWSNTLFLWTVRYHSGSIAQIHLLRCSNMISAKVNSRRDIHVELSFLHSWRKL